MVSRLIIGHFLAGLLGFKSSCFPDLTPLSFISGGRGVFLRTDLLIELIRQYGAVIELGVGLGWFGGVSYVVHMAARLLVGK